MNKKTTFSYKNTTKDIELYLVIQNLEEKSDTIKSILYQVLVEGKELKPPIEPNKKSTP
jgi:hypothetical protein